MTYDWISEINACCPLRITSASWQDPVLALAGHEWWFSCLSSWRIVDTDRMVVGCDDDDAGHAIDRLSNASVVRCESFSHPVLGDLRIIVTGGLALEVFVSSPTDPWVFHLPVPPTIVPAPGDPSWLL